MACRHEPWPKTQALHRCLNLLNANLFRVKSYDELVQEQLGLNLSNPLKPIQGFLDRIRSTESGRSPGSPFHHPIHLQNNSLRSLRECRNANQKYE